MSIKRRLITAAVAVASVALLATGCATGGSSSGSGSSSGASDIKDLNIGFFSPGTSNTYAATVGEGGVAEAKKLGVKLTNLNGNFDVQTQVNQMQQALQRKTYNAWVVVPLDPNQECPILERAVAAKIVVVMAVTPACGDTFPKGGAGLVAVQNADLYDQWWKYIFENTDPGEIAVMTGGSLDYVSQITNSTLKTALADHSDFKVVSNQPLDYSTDLAYKNAQALIKAYPNLKAIASNYSGMTQGALSAIKQAGKTGQIKLYDFDGDKTISDAITAGDVTMTIPGMPRSEGADAVQMVVDKWTGKKYEQILNPVDSLKITDGPFITKANVSEYTPEY